MLISRSVQSIPPPLPTPITATNIHLHPDYFSLLILCLLGLFYLDMLHTLSMHASSEQRGLSRLCGGTGKSHVRSYDVTSWSCVNLDDSKSKPISKLLQASYTLCDGQNGLSKLLQDSYTLCGGQHGVSEFLHASNTICRVQNGLSELPQSSYTLYGCQNQLSKLLLG